MGLQNFRTGPTIREGEGTISDSWCLGGYGGSHSAVSSEPSDQAVQLEYRAMCAVQTVLHRHNYPAALRCGEGCCPKASVNVRLNCQSSCFLYVEWDRSTFFAFASGSKMP